MELKKSVLLAFTGGKNSVAAAYLLLKQGYQVTACTFLMGDLSSTCVCGPLDKIKDVCSNLGIGHVSVDIREEFQEKVVSPLVCARLVGEDFNPCFYCNILKLESLIKKAEELGIEHIATGHNASVLQEADGVKLYCGGKNDQSFYISGLREFHLEHLKLPLGKLTDFDIERVTRSIGMDFDQATNNGICMDDFNQVNMRIDKNIPPTLRFEGLIFDDITKMTYGNHNGFHNFKLGQKNLNFWGRNMSSEATVVGFDLEKKAVLVRENAVFVQNYIEIILFKPFLDIDLSAPIKCFMAIHPQGEKISCLLCSGNNGNAFVMFQNNLEGPLEKGRLIVFYEKNDEVARLIASGFIFRTELIGKEKLNQTLLFN